jgi:hypothetical protein
MFVLLRDADTVNALFAPVGDTILIDDNLLPNQSYSYRAYRLTEGGVADSTMSVNMTTMDTTTHDVILRIDTLGGASSSVLNDLAIITENNIWAVGELYLTDSTGQLDPTLYNVAHWNGNQWEFLRFFWNCRLIYPNCGPDTLAISTGTAVFAKGSDDIWIASGVLHHFNGTSWKQFGNLGAVSITRIWASNSSNTYFVGPNGFIGLFNGFTWELLESGTTLDVYDVFGETNSATGSDEVMAVAAKHLVNLDHAILRITGSNVTSLTPGNISYSTQGLWFKPERRYYIVGDAMYTTRDVNTVNWQELDPTPYYKYAIRGIDFNEIWLCGSFGELLHFNGLSWRSYRTELAISAGILYKVEVKGNVIAAVGFDSPYAIVVRGTR